MDLFLLQMEINAFHAILQIVCHVKVIVTVECVIMGISCRILLQVEHLFKVVYYVQYQTVYPVATIMYAKHV